MERALQDAFAPNGTCFGCGPANEKGLRMRSFVRGDKVVASFRPEAFHHAFPGVLNGGIIGSLLDCHCNWTGAWALMQSRHAPKPPCTVTASYAIELMRPTPMDTELTLEAWALSIEHGRATIAGTPPRAARGRRAAGGRGNKLSAKGKICATCHGTFVAVTPGHPAYHGW
jgi:acyl-coenzyme A thioesterase PaaI-like protein